MVQVDHLRAGRMRRPPFDSRRLHNDPPEKQGVRLLAAHLLYGFSKTGVRERHVEEADRRVERRRAEVHVLHRRGDARVACELLDGPGGAPSDASIEQNV